ncbi:hypothetical protein [Gemella haemolysans]|uniref:hypothetical protein n=1 Tax=Gemella haemolysans TaxID=1379 RepID=UPI00195D403F|nr:hypothetical protein [Gemella haemolysans]VTX52189.1 Uncharacterised protein [Gemella haemolysans]
MAKKPPLSDNDILELLKEIKNEQTQFESKYKHVLSKYIETDMIDEVDFDELFSFTNTYKQYNLPYSTFTRFIFEVGEDIDLSDFIAELKKCLTRKIEKLKNSNGVYDVDRKQARIMAKIIEHTELALSQKNNLYTKQKELIDELTRELDSSKEKITSLTTKLNSSTQEITTLTNSVSAHKFDLIALMSVVFTIFTVLGVNASIIAAIATIKDLNIWKMIGLFVFGNGTLALMICCIMKFSKKYYMDFINNRN